MKQWSLAEFTGVQFGKNVSIVADKAVIKPGAVIGDDVQITSADIYIGHDSIIEKETVIKGLGGDMKRFYLGDNCLLGFRSQVMVPEFEMLDYSQLHNSGLHSGYKPLTIGYNCWIGQNTILNSTEELQIGNNVRIGTQSQLWTHVASGELMEGCTLYGTKPLILKDNVWIVGGAVISPGLMLERNAIIMTGSVLTKNAEAFNTYAGVPAKNVTDKLNFWKQTNNDEKFAKAQEYIAEFIVAKPEYKNKIFAFENAEAAGSNLDAEAIVILKDAGDLEKLKNKQAAVFDIASKMYVKKRSHIEIDWIKFTVGFRARFIPYTK
jgi:acetyltransferase-like isoleucine patch superfamily enzyme